MTDDTKWIDVSVPLRTGLAHWPGDPEPTFELISEIERGAEANVTLCRMTVHTGTHMDAPAHFLPGREGIDHFPIDAGIGPAKVVSVPMECNVIGPAELESAAVGRSDRLILKTRNSREPWHRQDFKADFVALNSAGARFLAEKGIAFLGVDYLSVGLYQSDGAATHRILLSAGIWIVEGLNLTEVGDGDYDLVCLPLRIEGGDGSPARVALRPGRHCTTIA
jgi:arylformamidase